MTVKISTKVKFNCLDNPVTYIHIHQDSKLIYTDKIEQNRYTTDRYPGEVSAALKKAKKLAVQLEEDLASIKSKVPPVEYVHNVTAMELQEINKKTKDLKKIKSAQVTNTILLYITMLVVVMTLLAQLLGRE